MNKKKQPSLHDIIKRRQNKDFVGRTEYLTLFKENLTRSWDDEERIFLFNIYGQGGVGKSTLLNRFRQLAENVGGVTVQTDETETDVPTVMARFSQQLREQGFKIDKFDERYKVYRQRRQELEVDPDAPQGFTAFTAHALTKAGVVLARQIPVGGTVFNLIDEDRLAVQVGEWAEYVRRKLTNKDEAHLILEPQEVLTPLFLEELYGIANEHLVCLFFDTYESTNIFLDSWIRNVLEGHYGDVPANLIIAIAGREQLNHNLWLPYENLVARIPLEQFSKDEVLEYLASKGIDNERVVQVILEFSGGLPLLVAMLAAEHPSDPKVLDDPSSTAVDRFLKWVADPKRRQVAINAALPRFLNRDIVALLVDSEEIDDLFTWLIKMPFIQERGDGWIYHEVVRTQMLRYKRRGSPQGWREIHKKLAVHYENLRDDLKLEVNVMRLDISWQAYELEARYHRLCQAPQEQLPSAINSFLNALNAKLEFGQRWATAMQQAGTDAENIEIKKWGSLLVNGLQVHKEKLYEKRVEMFSNVLQYSKLEAHPQAIALSWRGTGYRALRLYEKALADFNHAIQLKPEDPRLFHERGWVFMNLKHYEAAIADFDKAIQLDSKFMAALVDRGQALSSLRQYEKAILSISAAIEVDPENSHAFHSRGYTYLRMRQFKEALSDLNRAIEIDDKKAIVFQHRGDTYFQMGQQEQAITDFTHAFELEPDDLSALNRRGWNYYLMKRYEEAIADFNKVIETDPDNVIALVNRGQVYRNTRKYSDALKSLNEAVKIDPLSDWVYHNRGVTYLYAGRYEEAFADLNRAVELNNKSAIALTHRGAVYLKMEHYDKSLDDLNHALEIEPNNTYALSYRQQVYKALGNYDKSLTDLNRVIELIPNNSWYFYERGLAHQVLSEVSCARADFSTATQIAKQQMEPGIVDWRDNFNLALYLLANSSFAESSAMYKKVESDQVPDDMIQMAIEDLENYLGLFPEHIHAQVELDRLRQYRDQRTVLVKG